MAMNENENDPKGQPSSSEKTDSTGNDAPNIQDSNQPQPAQRPVSEKKRAANRENAKKSTGPRTERGRQYSRRNALKHGFFTGLAVADLEKTPGYEQLQTILQELGRRYAPETFTEVFALEKAALDLWRHGRAARAEIRIGNTFPGHVDGMPTVLRYVAQAERSVLQSLEVLKTMEEKPSEPADIAAESTAEETAGCAAME